MSKQRTVTIPLEEYDELRGIKNSLNESDNVIILKPEHTNNFPFKRELVFYKPSEAQKNLVEKIQGQAEIIERKVRFIEELESNLNRHISHVRNLERSYREVQEKLKESNKTIEYLERLRDNQNPSFWEKIKIGLGAYDR